MGCRHLKIRVEPSFVITLIMLFLTNEAKFVFFMLFSAMVHEVGHIATLTLFKVRIKALVLGLFGGTLVLEKKLISYKREALVSLSGPLVNLMFSALFFMILRRGFLPDIFFLFLSNLFYGAFNLLPISSLDGGMALVALLATKKELYDAEKTASSISRITLFFLAVISLFLVSLSAFNISLLVVTLLFYAESCEGHIISGYEFCRKTS